MAKKTATPEEKLRALYDLQIIDSKIDKIRIVRGELPLEVQDLEDELEGLKTRVEKLGEDSQKVKDMISDKKNAIEESKVLIEKYKEQQNNVRNNREYESLSKEIEYQDLEIQLCEKRIKEFQATLVNKKEFLDAAKVKLEDRASDLEAKKSELDEIIEETKMEEEILLKKSQTMEKKIEDRLLRAYKRIRGAAKNGLAVVPIEREASAGSYIKIPPQKQLDVAARKKIIVDEHSGRLLVDAELAQEEQVRMDSLIAKEMKKLAK